MPSTRWWVTRAVAPAAVVAVAGTLAITLIPSANAADEPISHGRPVTASSSEGANWAPERAVDGDSKTRWSSAFADPQWLRVDLGAPMNLDRVVLAWERSYATAYEVQASTDGAAWSTLYSTAAGKGGTETLDVSGTGRYVRVHGTKRATGYGYSLFEFEVHGTPAGGTPATSDPGPEPSTPATSDPAPPSPAGPSAPPSPAGPSAPPTTTDPVETGYVMADPPVTGVVPSAKQPPNAVHREFQANCAVSRSNLPDDPIVFPNLPGASHSHTFMGNTTTNAHSTIESLQAGETACITPGDRTAYWMPTLLNDGKAVQPVGVQTIYYKSGVIDYTSVRAFPAGLRYVVGSPASTQDAFRNHAGAVEGFECGDSYKNWDIPANCPAGTQVNIRLKAPSCWDGLHLDSPDHKSHMAYPVDGRCTASHPVAVPMIEFKMAWPVSGDMSKVAFSSGRGFSFHYDVYNAWDAPTLDALVKHCINGGLQCDPRGYDQFHPERGAALNAQYRLP
ncbi:hypothetical protein J2S43_007970 [Catenuloplanes nepalensis]|uniref:F5/8 type C domain-containing protein n=1 Tax=Catenuloplanes nepalensis TaxID=587533 RepID=A0ABT9N7F9_9ACTN|nr:DUF1996 domain-containing protein [Catenuloplanes nepalensis]MDP9799458.1 hypothetical protein [Catenuloplanes nepalensis]